MTNEQNKCKTEECDRRAEVRGLCPMHYMRFRRKRNFDDARKNARGICKQKGCDRPNVAFGECDMHYRRNHRPKDIVRHEGRICEQCSQEIPSDRRGGSIFCSLACKVKANNARIRRGNFMQKYGLSLEALEELKQKQNNKCAICGVGPERSRNEVLHVDHCHETGKVRGLLCAKCNTGLGAFNDNPELIEVAIRYLS